MTTPNRAALSSIVRKMVTAVTGLAIAFFAITHLLGNLTLYSRDPDLFNGYAFKLESYGFLLKLAEIGLFFFIIVHAINGMILKYGNRKARPIAYGMWRSKTGAIPSHPEHGAKIDTPSNLSSRTMFISGLLLLLFLAVHVYQFRFGPGIEAGYLTHIHGEDARDLHRLALEVFASPLNVGFYVVCMLFLGSHLKHGVWSGLHTLGLTRPHLSRALRGVSAVLGIALAAGFLGIPLWIYFR